MAKKKRYFSEMSKLQWRWVMLLVQSLMNKEELPRQEAMKKAWLTFKLLEALGKGIVEFSYKKQDGTTRQARGTLHRGVSESFDNYKSKGGKSPRDNSNTDGIYVYWDLDKNGFRSFHAQDLIQLKNNN